MPSFASGRGIAVGPDIGASTSHIMEESHVSATQWRSRNTSTARRMERLKEMENKREELKLFVQKHFTRKQCIKFVSKDPMNNDPKCKCGDNVEKHLNGADNVREYYLQKMQEGTNPLANSSWDETRCIIPLVTNAYGKIVFQQEGIGRAKPSKYVRLADNTSPELVLKLMTDFWHMYDPELPTNLVITVIGGAKNFRLDGKKKEIFNKGLVNAAQTTNAWIITSGCNMGVMKASGEAVREGQSYRWDNLRMTHTLKLLGIAPWGYVESKEDLEKTHNNGSWNAKYKVNNVVRHGQPVSLNPDHTHFLLVDNGYRGSYGGVAEFRAALEKQISKPISEKGLGVPTVLVVVEGGYDAILDAQKSIQARIPVVVCEGTGRAADIIAYAYSQMKTDSNGKRFLKEIHLDILGKKLVEAYGDSWRKKGKDVLAAKKAEFLEIVQDCCADEKLITVFSMDTHEDLDLAILSALLKGQGAKDISQLRDQLKLALTWNRSDVAEEKIFSDDIIWNSGYLDDIMTTALIDNRVNFVRLLLQNGVVLREYLTGNQLLSLYNLEEGKVKDPGSRHLRQLLWHYRLSSMKESLNLRDIHRLFQKLMGKHMDSSYLEMESNRESTFDNPIRELFLWAVLMNRQDMAKFLWERGVDAIPSALAATKLYASLADKLPHYDSDLRAIYNKNKREFEKLAIKVLDQCHLTDPDKAAMLITLHYPTWGEMTCLEMAADAEDREFISTVACQNSLNKSWKLGIRSSWPKILLALIAPFCIYFVRFQNFDADDDEKKTALEKIKIFYRAPVTKFAAHVMMYIVFLLLYSYVILFDFKVQMTLTEKIILIWMGTVALEEIRTMFFSSKADSVIHRVIDWWTYSVFNRLDLIIIIMFIVGLSLRFSEEYFTEAKTVYCVNCVLLFIRILRDYSASSHLGPKLVMITKMFRELILYIMILMVLVLAYGISTYALKYQSRSFYWGIFRDIFYYPYWQIYGELFLEELEGRTDECSGNKTGVVMSDGSPCPQFSWLVPALTAIYLLIGNILLLNLLIAIFNHVFEEVEKNAIEIWKFGMYFLVVEYTSKPGLAPPLIIFEHVYLFIKWLCNQTCCGRDNEGTLYNAYMIEMLQIFEKEMVRTCHNSWRVTIRENESRHGGTSTAGQSHMVKILTRVDEMANKLLEEEKLFENRQDNGNEANQRNLMKHEFLKDMKPSNNSKVAMNSLGENKADIFNKAKLELDRDVKSNDDDYTKPKFTLGTEGEDGLNQNLGEEFEQNQEITKLKTPMQPSQISKLTKKKVKQPHGSKAKKEIKANIIDYDPTNHGNYRRLEQDDSSSTENSESGSERKIVQKSHIKRKYERATEEIEMVNRGRHRQRKQSRDAQSESQLYSAGSGGRHFSSLSPSSSRAGQVHAANDDETEADPRSIGGNTEKLDKFEERIAALEAKTGRQLYNIEALLRNAVFQRGEPRMPSVSPNIGKNRNVWE